MNSPAVNVALGGRANDFSQKWDGKLDEVRIYNTAQSAATIWGLLQPYAEYQSRASGNWNAVSTWNVRLDSGQSYFAATTTDQLPTSSTVQGITILNGHTVTVTASVSVDQVTVNPGGQIKVNSGPGPDG